MSRGAVAFWSLPHPLLPATKKMLSNVLAAKARGRRVVAVGANGDEALHAMLAGRADAVLEAPACRERWSPFLSLLPLPLLGHPVALRAGRDVEQPRNLAKPVTAE